MEKTQQNDTLIELIDLHPFELKLIKRLRYYQYGEVTIIMKDGLPMRFKRITEIEDLANN